MIDIYIIRHGQAEAHCSIDAERKLTERGVNETRKTASWLAGKLLAKQPVTPLSLLSINSPYIRAAQTAEIIVNSLEAEQKATSIKQIVTDDLIPTASPELAYDYITALVDTHQVDHVIVVSHMPLVTFLTECFTLGVTSPLFMTASCAHVRYDMANMRGVFEEMVSPDDL
ncbi:phosphohistidine phosphatase SixA [Flocculibacter collagenilyticus]|uniref:phosphohistidine phosphatase SixA n=1 Tax=Flocculibacter collagenilyticus TaxID=2744479 RepID=UPI0018F51360|nr:phosphohistidine phosphatase SixA [Flocculibacter collagenilyticus]